MFLYVQIFLGRGIWEPFQHVDGENPVRFYLWICLQVSVVSRYFRLWNNWNKPALLYSCNSTALCLSDWTSPQPVVFLECFTARGHACPMRDPPPSSSCYWCASFTLTFTVFMLCSVCVSVSYLNLDHSFDGLDFGLAEGPSVLGADIRPDCQVGRLIHCLKDRQTHKHDNYNHDCTKKKSNANFPERDAERSCCVVYVWNTV